MLIIIGGPAGCGKSTVCVELSTKLECTFLEGDSLHPKANVEKMAHGIPLTDDDRWGWLAKVAANGKLMAEKSSKHICVASCSALTRAYRDFLREKAGSEPVLFVFLNISKAELVRRISARKGHFMKTNMLDSQLQIMQVPGPDEPDCIVEDEHMDPNELYEKVLDMVLVDRAVRATRARFNR